MIDSCRRFIALIILWPLVAVSRLLADQIPEKYTVILQEYEEKLERNPDNFYLIRALADAYSYYKVYPKAIKLYQRALALHPSDNGIKTSLGLAYLGINDFVSSKELFEEVYKEEPKNVKVLGGLGRIEALQQNYDAAESFYSKALAISPKDFATLYFWGELQLDKKNYSAARKIFTDLLEENPKATWVYQALQRANNAPSLGQMDRLAERDNYETAIALGQQELGKNKDNPEMAIALSELYLKIGKYDEALALLQNAINLRSDSSALYAALGDIFLATHNLDEARQAFHKALSLDSISAPALVGLGQAAEAEGQSDKAIFYYQKALITAPSNFHALSRLASLLSKQGDYANAKKLYDKLLKLIPGTPWLLEAKENAEIGPKIEKIKQLENSRNYSQAIALYRSLLDSYPDNLELYLGLGELFVKLQRFDDALYIYQIAEKKVELPQYIWIAIGNAYIAKGDLDRAKEFFEKALQADSRQEDALTGIGRLYALVQDFTTAETYFYKVLKINPHNLTALSYLASAKLKQKKYREAAKLYESIVQSDPSANWAKEGFELAKIQEQLDEAAILIKNQEYKKAQQFLEELVEKNPDSTRVYLELGHFYLARGLVNKAVELYDRGLKRNPHAIELEEAIAFAFIQQGAVDKADRIFTALLKADPGNLSAIVGQGRLAALRGDIKSAAESYQSVLQKDPNNITALSFYVDMLYKQKKYKEAEAIYEKLLELEPNEQWIKVALENAKQGPILEQIHQKEEEKDHVAVESLYRQLLQDNPKDVDLYVLFGRFYAKLHRLEEATSIFLQGLVIDPKNLALQESLAYVAIEKNELTMAQQTLERIVAADQKNATAKASLGFIAEKQGFEEKAVQLYKQALEIDPKNITALSYLGGFYLRHKKYHEAFTEYDKIVQIDPKAIWAKDLAERAKLSPLLDEIAENEKEHNWKESAENYIKLLDAAPANVEFAIRAGQFFVQQKKYEEAVNVYTKALEKNPKNTELLVALGYANLSYEKHDASVAAFNSALAVEPANGDALAGLAKWEILENHLSEAESLLKKAVKADPEGLATLSTLAMLRLKQKRYSEAVHIYEKLDVKFPDLKWVKFALNEAKYAPTLDDIRKEEEHDNLEKVANLYEKLVWAMPDNAYYYLGLGQAYVRLKKFSEAWRVYRQGLEVQPEANEIRIAWGYSYLFSDDPRKAIEMLQLALEHGSPTAEILAGLGRAKTMQMQYCEAEELLLKALEVNPKSVSALTFYARLLAKEKRYDESQEIYYRLWLLDTSVRWVVNEWEDARDGFLIDEAKAWEDASYFDEAKKLYRRLLCYAPQNPDRYSKLGRVYVSNEEYNHAIDIYQKGLQIDPLSNALWRGLAFAYVKQEEYATPRYIFTDLIAKDPTDAESWAGLAVIEQVDGSEQVAEDYYQKALSIDAQNVTALSYLAEFRRRQQNIWEAADLYRQLHTLLPAEKWARVEYRDLLNQIRPTLTGEGHYHEEDEWDASVKQWIALYRVYGISFLFTYPLTCTFTLAGRGGNDIYTLQDTLNHTTEYSFDVKRAYGIGHFVLSTHWAMHATLGASFCSEFQSSTFKLQRESIFEPALVFTYQRRKEKALFGVMSDVDLVARNFNTNHAKMVGRYFLRGQYEREVIRYGTVGFQANAYFYGDYVHNRSQALMGWFDWRPPDYHKYIILRYFWKFQTFDKNIPDYYTYKYQLINHFQLTLERSWNVCWADYFYTNIGYAHGWQDTRTKFKQIIVVNPTPIGPCSPYLMDRRNYNYFFSNISYKQDRLQANLSGNAYRDSQRYIIWEILGSCTWRF
jgi:tetratricopeptide (TPR) repeat protein